MSDIKWTYEKCKEVASTCKTRTEFVKNHSGAYSAAYKNKWITEFTELYFPSARKYKDYWNDYNTCKDEASKYKNVKEFALHARKAYDFSKKNDWLKDFFSIEEKKTNGILEFC